jgi:hypothetical protein
MSLIVKRVYTVGFFNAYGVFTIPIKQCDVGRKITLHIVDEDGHDADLSGLDISFYMVTSTELLYYNPTPDFITVEGSDVTITTAPGMLAYPGINKCEIRFQADGLDVTTWNFNFDVVESERRSKAPFSPESQETILDHIIQQIKEAQDLATLSESYAKGGTGIREGEDTDNSKYYSEQSSAYNDSAQTSANNAQASADDAQTSAQNAKESADNAKTSEDNAQASADDAQTSANNAQASADDAQASANNAKESADNAKTSEDNAQTAMEVVQNALDDVDTTVELNFEDGCLYYTSGVLNLVVDNEDGGLYWSINK